jgi:hypothetical protein
MTYITSASYDNQSIGFTVCHLSVVTPKLRGKRLVALSSAGEWHLPIIWADGLERKFGSFTAVAGKFRSI